LRFLLDHMLPLAENEAVSQLRRPKRRIIRGKLWKSTLISAIKVTDERLSFCSLDIFVVFVVTR